MSVIAYYTWQKSKTKGQAKRENFCDGQVQICFSFNNGIEVIQRAGTFVPDKFRFAHFHPQNRTYHTCMHSCKHFENRFCCLWSNFMATTDVCTTFMHEFCRKCALMKMCKMYCLSLHPSESNYSTGGTFLAIARFKDSDFFQKAIKMVLRCILNVILHLSGFKL